MGTVGLSFGSPTSGAGFDVSSTVAEIVGNLQNVETPWKTQLTKLESQDTAISSLGTLFSSLTNDISALTDFQGILAEKTGSSSDTNVLTLTAADNTAVAGTHTITVKNLATTSSGYLAPITDASDLLSGAITVQVGSGGTPQKITLNTNDDTLAGLASAINSSSAGVTASVLTDSSGSRLSLVSGTSGAAGTIVVSANSIVDTSNSKTALNYSASPVVPMDASLTVDGVNLTSASNTVANLIPGVTFQLTAPSASESDGSLEQIQVVIGNDNSGIESTVTQMVSDYNALVSAMNTQEGLDSSGNAEPLFGSPTLSLLQQQLLGGLNLQNPNGELDSIPANTGTTLAGSIAITVAGGFNLGFTNGGSNGSGMSTGTLSSISNSNDTLTGSISIQVGEGTAQTITVGSSGDTLSTLAKAINSADPGVTASVVPNSDGSSSLSLVSGTAGTAGILTIGSEIRDTSTQTITLGNSDNTLSGMATAINAAHIGVTADVSTSSGNSTLSLLSETAGPNGALTVNSTIVASGNTAISYSDNGTDSTEASGSLAVAGGSVVLDGSPVLANGSDTVSGSVSLQVGSGTAQNFVIGSAPVPPAAHTTYTGSGAANTTLSALADTINNANIGVSASLVASDGNASISLVSSKSGVAGALTVASSLFDTSSQTGSTLAYNNSSDLSTLSNLGITVSDKDDGSLVFDATTLDSTLNSDYSSVVGFFQNANSWGQNFSTMLNNAGTTSSTGSLALSKKSNSSTESTLNADISKEENLISAQQKSLTAELNSANEIMQELPSQLEGVNELYSAITGYNQQTNG